MLTAGLSAFAVFMLIKLLERGKEESHIDGFASFVFVIVPYMIMFLIGLAVGIFSLPEWLTFIGPVFFFGVPLFLLKYQFEFNWSKAAGYASAILACVITTELLFMAVFPSPNA